MGGEITNQSGKGDKRIFQTLKEKSLDLPKEESLGIFSKYLPVFGITVNDRENTIEDLFITLLEVTFPPFLLLLALL